MRALHTLINRTLTLLVLLFSFMASPALLASSITSPTMGSTLDGGAQTITWETGGQTVEQWAIYAGSSVGAYDHFISGNVGHATSTTVLFLPIDGTTVYIRLWLKIAGVWEAIDTSYSAAEYTFSLPPGSTLAGANQNYTWATNGGTITQWALYAGGTPGSYNYKISGGANSSNSVTTVVSGLPTDSSIVYFRLWMQVGGYWEKLDVSYNAVAPYTITPANGAAFTSTSEMFTWNTTGGAIDEWAFNAGSSPGSLEYHYATGTGVSNSTTATGLPNNGSTVYVRIWFKIEGNWEKVDLTYTAIEVELISITSPVVGNNLDGSSQQFIWDPQGQTIHSWVLYLGTSVGASDYHVSSGTGNTTSSVASGLPTDGSMVYARLWYQLSGEPFMRKIDRSYSAAPLDIVWDRTLGGQATDVFRATLFDPATNLIYAVGYEGSTDAFYATLDANGTTQAYKTFGGSGIDIFEDIVADGSGNFYVVGNTDSSDGDITDGNNGSTDALIIKFDHSFNEIWHRTVGGSGTDRFDSVTVDPAGSIYAVGWTTSADGDITDGNNGATDALLVMFDSNGNLLWDKTIGGSLTDTFSALALDASGNIYAAGKSSSNNGDITDGNNGLTDTLLVKLDRNGVKLWDKTEGGIGTDSLAALVLDSNDNIYVAGRTDDFNFTPDATLMKFDSSTGTKLWDKTIGGSNPDAFSDLLLDASGNIYTVGYSQSIDGDINDGQNGAGDALLMRLDNSGNIQWVKTVGGSSSDSFGGLSFGAGGHIYAAGSSQSNNGDITDGNAGGFDALIIKFDE